MSDHETHIIQSAKAGNRQAFRSLVDQHGRRMYQLAFRITANETAAEDVVQEAFINAFRNLDKFRQQASFATWLHRITVNAAIAWLRRRSSRDKYETENGELSLQAAEASRDCPLESAEIRRFTRTAMKQLTPVERAAFTLRHFEGHSIREISRLLDINQSASKQAIFRAVKKMRAALAPLVTT